MKERTTNQASADSVMNDLRTTLVFQPNDPRFWKALVGLVSLVVDRPGMGPGMSHELTDPDGYPVLLTAAEGAGAVSS